MLVGSFDQIHALRVENVRFDHDGPSAIFHKKGVVVAEVLGRFY